MKAKKLMPHNSSWAKQGLGAESDSIGAGLVPHGSLFVAAESPPWSGPTCRRALFQAICWNMLPVRACQWARLLPHFFRTHRDPTQFCIQTLDKPLRRRRLHAKVQFPLHLLRRRVLLAHAYPHDCQALLETGDCCLPPLRILTVGRSEAVPLL